MVRTASDMLPLGTPAPGFRLKDAVSGRRVSLEDQSADRPLLVMFVCNHCPYVVHVRDEFLRLARDYDGRISIVAINSNSLATHPQDGPEAMGALARELGWSFPFLFDEAQEVARAYHAACTPDFFVFDALASKATRASTSDALGTRTSKTMDDVTSESMGAAAAGARRLAYRGQLDASRPGNTEPVTGADLRNAIDALLAGTPVNSEQRPSLGCNIKWSPGEEPDYFAAAH